MCFRRLGALEKSQPSSAAGPAAAADSTKMEIYARPMMEAVAISSSSSAKDTLPDTL